MKKISIAENDLENILIQDMSVLEEGMIFLKRQNVVHDNLRPDIIAVDKVGKLCIIELKNEEAGENAIFQILEYVYFFKTHINTIKKSFPKIKHEDIRVIIVATSFDKTSFSLADALKYDIELISYTAYKDVKGIKIQCKKEDYRDSIKKKFIFHTPNDVLKLIDENYRKEFEKIIDFLEKAGYEIGSDFSFNNLTIQAIKSSSNSKQDILLSMYYSEDNNEKILIDSYVGNADHSSMHCNSFNEWKKNYIKEVDSLEFYLHLPYKERTIDEILDLIENQLLKSKVKKIIDYCKKNMFHVLSFDNGVTGYFDIAHLDEYKNPRFILTIKTTSLGVKIDWNNTKLLINSTQDDTSQIIDIINNYKPKTLKEMVKTATLKQNLDIFLQELEDYNFIINKQAKHWGKEIYLSLKDKQSKIICLYIEQDFIECVFLPFCHTIDLKIKPIVIPAQEMNFETIKKDLAKAMSIINKEILPHSKTQIINRLKSSKTRDSLKKVIESLKKNGVNISTWENGELYYFVLNKDNSLEFEKTAYIGVKENGFFFEYYVINRGFEATKNCKKFEDYENFAKDFLPDIFFS